MGYVRDKIRASKRGRKNPSGDNFKFKSKAKLAQSLDRHSEHVANVMDDLDQWHRPGSGTPLDKAYKALEHAHNCLFEAMRHYE